MKKHDYIAAIDPDCEKSGVALLSMRGKKMEAVHCFTFPKLLQYLTGINTTCQAKSLSLLVIVEAGWLNESNWHIGRFDSKAVAAAKGNAVGRNHETGRKIVEMCKHYAIEVQEVKPLKKCWHGPTGKITHEEISQFITGFPLKSNQEVRDAALIAWHYSGLPIQIKPIKKVANAVHG